jgi:adenine-specific DNA methylase
MSAESDDGKRPAAASDDIEMTKCPQNLSGKRDFLFRGYDPAKKSKFIIDEVAAFSVTESQSADEMTRVILAEFPKDSGMKSASDLVILDGMACVGGNTISFSKAFKRTLSNELDEGRFKILRHNVVEVMGCSNVEFFNNSILDLVKDVEFDVLFLDPEWGGPSYKDSSSLRLSISDVAMEDFVLKVFHDFPGVSMVALKLPVNYDNAYLKSFADSNGLSYQFFVKFRKMTLTILKRKRV